MVLYFNSIYNSFRLGLQRVSNLHLEPCSDSIVYMNFLSIVMVIIFKNVNNHDDNIIVKDKNVDVLVRILIMITRLLD